MFELIIISMVSLWGADNHAFLERLSPHNWEYVGYTEREHGRQKDGAYAMTAKSGGKSYILFKQRKPQQTAAGAVTREFSPSLTKDTPVAQTR